MLILIMIIINNSNNKKVKPWRHDWLVTSGAYPGFCSMKQLKVFLLPLDGMLVHHRSLPCNLLGFPNNLPLPIYTPGWREALWEYLGQEHNTMSPARVRTQSARSGVERTNHEATALPNNNKGRRKSWKVPRPSESSAETWVVASNIKKRAVPGQWYSSEVLKRTP